MTNNTDDFDQPEFGNEELPPPKGGIKANLTEAWRTRPLFKLLVLMTVVGAVIAASISLFSGGAPSPIAQMVRPPDVKEAPGGPVSPYMREQTEKADQQRVQEAVQHNGSALPTPMGPNTDLNDLGGDRSKNDPLKELEAEVEQQKQQLSQMQRQQQIQATPTLAPTVAQRQQQQFDDTLAQAMQRQMQQLMDSWAPHGAKDVTVSKADEEKTASATAGTSQAAAAALQASEANYTPPKIVVPAGTVSYAQLLTEANSDVPGAILAQIVSGPLSGARAVGHFEVENDYLVLHFGLADLKGKDYQIDALALDPNTTLGGMATEVDERYFTRLLLPAAAGFMQGFGSALGSGSSSIVSNGTTTVVQQSGRGIDQGAFQGLSQGAQTMSQFFENQANQIKPLVRVAAGTPMGLFFITSVQDTTLQQYPYGYGAWPQGVAGYPGATGYGYNTGYGSNIQGYGAGLPGGYYPGAMAGYGGYGQYGQYGQSQYGQSPAVGVPYPNAANPYPATNSVGFPSNGSVTVLPNTGIGTTTLGH